MGTGGRGADADGRSAGGRARTPAGGTWEAAGRAQEASVKWQPLPTHAPTAQMTTSAPLGTGLHLKMTEWVQKLFE